MKGEKSVRYLGAKGLVQAIMKNILVTQEHDSVVSRCTEQMFAQVFAQKRLKKQPTLLWLREEGPF